MRLREEITTIKITNENHQKLLALKIHPRESFNEVISRLVDERTKLSKCAEGSE